MKDIEFLKQLAYDARLSISDEDMPSLIDAYKDFMDQIQILEDIETEGVEPLVFPFESQNYYLRLDDVEDIMEVDDVLKNAKEVQEQQVKVPKVVNS